MQRFPSRRALPLVIFDALAHRRWHATANESNKPTADSSTASSSTTAEVNAAGLSAPRKQRAFPKLYNLMKREMREEQIRDHRPPLPHVPTGWRLEHSKTSNRFDLFRNVEIRDAGPEEMHVIALMEVKQYESTYRMDTGERNEEEHLTFSLFLKKERWAAQGKGGIEFTFTSIDHELVLDNVCLHNTPEDFENAKVIDKKSFRTKRDLKYRGPMVQELDDDLSDEILDYLDERGVNNGFAEYMQAQAHYIEQQEYEHWISLLQQYAE